MLLVRSMVPDSNNSYSSLIGALPKLIIMLMRFRVRKKYGGSGARLPKDEIIMETKLQGNPGIQPIIKSTASSIQCLPVHTRSWIESIAS